MSSHLVLPSGIDIHVHFRQPGLTAKETFVTGKTAAFHGGITTTLEMPNTIPVMDSIASFKQKQELNSKSDVILAKDSIKVKTYLVGGLTEKNTQNPALLRELSKETKIFKVFMANSTGDLMISKKNLRIGLETLESCNEQFIVMFHAEDHNLIRKTLDWRNHSANRPLQAEINAINEVLELKDEFNLNFHITHVSAGSSAEIMGGQQKVTWDVLHKYLQFSENDLSEFQNLGVMNPPLRVPSERELLTDLFKEGKIPIVSSDHAPHTLQDKKNAISGAPGVQELYPFLIDQHLGGELRKKILTNMISDNPRKLLSKVKITPPKGEIIVDTEKFTTFKGDEIKSKCGWSLWSNLKLKGKILSVSLK